MGRIASNTYSSQNTSSNYRTYTYDQYGQLIRENNEGLDKTFVYEYNKIGNITNVKEYKFTLNITPSGDYTEKTYTYNTTYNYDNSGRLVREYCSEKYIGGSTKTRDITYLYDESGIVGAIQKYNSTEEIFYFDKNIKGDVIALYNSSGAKIANYSYDSWGNCTTKTIVANNFSAYNPIRYRGYYFDRETGLYFLNARYYNPTWRRFISPDDTAYLDPETPNGLNLYAYCNNDPVNFSDPSGNSIIAVILITTTLVGATIGGVVSYNQQKETTGKVKFSKMILPIIGGALLGLAAGGLIVGMMGAFYGTYKAITLSKAFADIILYGVGVKQWVASGLLAYNVGSYLGGIIFGVTFEMIEPGTPNINPNQPIIENQPQKYR